MSRGANKCQNTRWKIWVFNYFKNLLVSVVSLILSGKKLQAAGPAWPVAALAMGLRGSSPPYFFIKWCFVSISKWQLSLSAIAEGLHLTVKCKKKRVWRPGSARTRWGSLQRSPDHLAGFKGSTSLPTCLLLTHVALCQRVRSVITRIRYINVLTDLLKSVVL